MSDSFRLVTDKPGDTATARASLAARSPKQTRHDHAKEAEHYQLRPELELSVNMAIAVGAPLLVTGEPGTGKTQLAWYLGHFFGIKVHSYVVRSTSTAESLKYDFDAVGYLHWAQSRDPSQKTRSDFLKPGPLWSAYADPNPSVLLIDEIDKAPRDFPNDLLHELDQHKFPHPFEDKEIAPKHTPIVVITSNVERRLPDAFLRRCIYHHIKLDDTLVNTALAARKGMFPGLTTAAIDAAKKRFFELRSRELSKPPSLGELLVWLAILSAKKTPESELETALAALPAHQALVKDEKDLKRL